jgi:putative sugar O-methyltransferase
MRAWLGGREPVFRLSHFWEQIAARQIDLLRDAGIENFKRVLPQNYFNWAVGHPVDPQFVSLLRSWADHPSTVPLAAKLRGSARVRTVSKEYLASPIEQEVYAFFVGLLWRHATCVDPDGLASRLSEPRVGGPVPIYLEGRLISQDLANSLREFRPFQRFLTGSASATLAELGAGYGRLGCVAMAAASCRYWVFDVPPALAVSEWYLSTVFPNKRIFRWRPFEDWESVAAEIGQSDIAFFTVDQLASLPPRRVDVFASVSVIHEMTPAQVETYMRLQFRSAARAVYTKNWTAWFNDVDQHRFESKALTPAEGWLTERDAVDDVLPTFTEKLFVRDSA